MTCAIHSPEETATTRRPRDAVDTIRVRYWYEGLRRHVGARSAYQLEKRFEPGSFTKADGRKRYRSKWARYAKGRHTPHRRLVERVAGEALGSERELNHPLWSILKALPVTGRDVTVWVERLEPQVQNAIHRRLHDGQGAVRARLAYTDALGRNLVRVGDLDALACLLLYWGESITSTDRDARTHPAIRIYQLLLILGMDFMRRGLLDDIFAVFRARVFDHTVTEYGRLCVDAARYQASTRVLHLLRTKTPEAPPHAAWATQVRVMLRLLEGGKGFDVR